MPQRKSCLETAVGLLSRREYAQAELTQKLKEKSFALPEIQEVVTGLVRKGYVDDRRFAEGRVRHRATNSKWGWQKIVLELRACGVSSDDIDAARAGLEAEGVSFAEEAAELASNRVRRRALSAEIGGGGGDRAAENMKLLQSLVRRGYTLEEARKAVEAASEDA